jgi:hypothetical protein
VTREPLSQRLGALVAAAAPAPLPAAQRRLYRQLCTEAERASKGRACGAPVGRVGAALCEVALQGRAAAAVAAQVARRFAAAPGWACAVVAEGERACVRLTPVVEAEPKL